MTLENIKKEINTRLREIRTESLDFSETDCYGDLQKLITKTITRVSLCESATDIEALDDLLAAIEDCYNDCISEKMGERREIDLFAFDFELDETELDDEDSSDEENDISTNKPKSEQSEDDLELSTTANFDKTEFVQEVEELFLKCYEVCVFADHVRLKSIRKKAIASIRMAEDRSAAVSAVFAARNGFNIILKHSSKVKDYHAAKPLYDELQTTDKMKRTNIARIVLGLLATFGGAAYGFFDARWWPWETLPLAITGIGLSCLVLSLIYGISISVSTSMKTSRRLTIMRLYVCLLAAVGSIPLGFVFDMLGGIYPFLGAYIATLPFTLFGLLAYAIYRFKLWRIVRKQKSKK